MAPWQYLNFDLLIEPFAGAYRARVLDAPAGQAVTTFAGLPNVPTISNSQRVMEVGAILFKAVFSGEVGTCLRRSEDEAERQAAGLRIRIRLDDPALMGMPWEYLYDPVGRRFLALSISTPIVRYLEFPDRVDPLPVALPLRILALISSPFDYAPLDVDREWSQMQQALADLVTRKLVVIERLELTTVGVLQQRLREQPFQVLHFIGHGEVNEHDRYGTLIFGGADEPGVPVSGFTLGALLRDHPSLRLLVLNACFSAHANPAADPFAGVAQQSVQQGIPAVVAMRNAFSEGAAISFSHTFYASLKEGFGVEAALGEARKAMYSQGEPFEWATPVLFMRASDSRLWQINDGGQQMDEQPWWEKLPPQAAGDVIVAEIGAGASGVAVGKGITQTIMTSLGPPQPDDKRIIEEKLAHMLAALHQPSLTTDPRTATMAEFQLQLLKSELTKIGDDEVPSASTLTQVGDWLLNNVPEIAELLASLFATPAVGKVVGKAGVLAVDWVKQRFGAS